jgi:hypothetical protein
MRSSAAGAIGALWLLIALASAYLAQADPLSTVGVRNLEVLSPERGVMLDATVWYPAGAGGTAVSLGDNAVFHGALARQGAAIAGSPCP